MVRCGLKIPPEDGAATQIVEYINGYLPDPSGQSTIRKSSMGSMRNYQHDAHLIQTDREVL